MQGPHASTGARARVRELQALSHEFVTLHQVAYDVYYWVPDHHYVLHVHEQALADGFYLDCFVHERKHKMVKREATPITCTSQFERSVVCRLVHKTLMQEGVPHTCITGRGLWWRGVLYQAGDVVFGDGRCYLLKSWVETNDAVGFIASPLTKVGNATPRFELRRALPERVVWPTHDLQIQSCEAWYRRADGDFCIKV